MEIKKDTKAKVPYRPELGTGAVLQLAEAPGANTRLMWLKTNTKMRFGYLGQPLVPGTGNGLPLH